MHKNLFFYIIYHYCIQIGAFLIPYVIMVMLVGIPLVFLEMSLGQYSRRGIVPLWRICPLFEGN